MQRFYVSFLFVALLFLPQLTVAQDSDALGADAEALQFRMAPNFQLGSFQGTLLSYKRHTTSMNAYRVGVGFSLQSEDKSFTPSDIDAPGIGRQSIDLRGQYLTYLGGDEGLEPYYGVGPELFYSRESEDDPTGGVENVTQTEWGIGVNGAAGVEWFVWSNVSFLAEYRASLVYVSEGQTVDPEVGDTSSASRSMWRLGGDGVQFGISAYF